MSNHLTGASVPQLTSASVQCVSASISSVPRCLNLISASVGLFGFTSSLLQCSVQTDLCLPVVEDELCGPLNTCKTSSSAGTSLKQNDQKWQASGDLSSLRCSNSTAWSELPCATILPIEYFYHTSSMLGLGHRKRIDADATSKMVRSNTKCSSISTRYARVWTGL